MKRKRQQAGIAGGDDADEEEREEDCERRKFNLRQKKTVNYNLDVSNEDVEEEEEGEEDKDDSFHPQKRKQEKLLEVRCGTKMGLLDVRKLSRGDICIKCNGHWYSPPAFEKLGKKSTINRWKATIIYKNKPLQFWLEQGFLTSKPFKRGRGAKKRIQSSDDEKEEEHEAEDSEPQSAEENEEDEVKDDATWEMDETGEEGAAECDDGGVESSEKVSVEDEDDGTENGAMEEEKEEDVAAVVAHGLTGSRDAEEFNTPLISSTPKIFDRSVQVVLRRIPQRINKPQEPPPTFIDEAKSDQPTDSSEEASICAESEKEPSCEDKESEAVQECDAPAAQESFTEAGDEREQAERVVEGFQLQETLAYIFQVSSYREDVSVSSSSPVLAAAASDEDASVDRTELDKKQDAESESEETKQGDSESKEQSNLLASEDDDPLCTKVDGAPTSDQTPDQQDTTEETREAKSPSPEPQSLPDCRSSQESLKLTDSCSADQDSAQPPVTELETSIHETPLDCDRTTMLAAAASSEWDTSLHQGTLEGAHAPNAPQTTTSLDGKNLDAIDLDQLKREKLKMQLKVLMLQEEYYSLIIKEMKQKSNASPVRET